ncbi:MAG: 2-succinyl-6-hydroxy-2,4-cyclohexadiene-carboxylate synthase [Solirubrobacteraceae bacterium]|nr:2-succinyl-6-hydroxy-2,4-cyclohexadiene-carboxylate synthase [Solirubrobacteraceae bacterium]
MPESVVLLHGFSGTGRAWEGVAAALRREGYRPLAPDLPGHGAHYDFELPITFDACVREVLAEAPDRFLLGGYSLGGRVALHVALSAPERVSRLVLVSSTAGIEDAVERTARSVADHLLADELERMPFEDFIERWRAQPLFADEPAEVGRLAREDQRRNRPQALAEVLRGIGVGEMEPVWDQLAGLHMPVSVVVGDRDAKYVALGRRLAAAAPHGRLFTVAGGHNLALENPDAVARVIASA